MNMKILCRGRDNTKTQNNDKDTLCLTPASYFLKKSQRTKS